VEAKVARRLWRLFDPYHAVTYFAPECRDAFKSAGLKGFWMGYFAGRAAPMGEVGPGVVTATFFGFHPAMVARALPDAWGFAPAAAVLDARLDGVDKALRRLLGAAIDDPGLADAAGLARDAIGGVGFAGRPLFAANAGLAWPDPPHLALWHATTLLREHRGDGHVAALVAAGLDGCSAHLTLVATGALSRQVLQSSRGWSDDEWDAAAERLRERGWLDESGALTEGGRATRRAVEDATDELAMEPWSALGEKGTERVTELLEPVARAVAAEIPLPNPIGLS
jgi:helix-turn-helix protein